MEVKMNRCVTVIAETNLELKSAYNFLASLDGPVSSYEDSLIEWPSKKAVAMTVSLSSDVGDYTMKPTTFQTRKAAESIQNLARQVFYNEDIELKKLDDNTYIVK